MLQQTLHARLISAMQRFCQCEITATVFVIFVLTPQSTVTRISDIIS